MKLRHIAIAVALMTPALSSNAAGPTRHLKNGPCTPLPDEPTICREDNKRWLVMKADGSGTMVMGFVRGKPGMNGFKKAARAFGGSASGPIPDNRKEYFKNGTAWGLIEAKGTLPVEPPVYEQIIPISDKFAIAQPWKVLSGHDENKYYIVPIDGKLTKLGEPIGNYRHIYWAGGYSKNSPIKAFVNRRQTSVGTDTWQFDQIGPNGNVVASFDNIISTNEKLTFHTEDKSGLVFAKAVDPITGYEASVRWGPMGDFLGYFPKIELLQMVTDGGSAKTEWALMQEVGSLPISTDLPDHTLYRPLDASGEPVIGPENFIGMTPLYDNKWYFGTYSQKLKDWLLVYRVPGGFGYKIAGKATRGGVDGNSAFSPISILASEADYVMLAGFDYRGEYQPGDQPTIKDLWSSKFVQLYSDYQADGVTPADGALPANWRALSSWYAEPLNFNAERKKAFLNFTGGDSNGWTTSDQAIRATYQKKLRQRAQYAAWEREQQARLDRATREKAEAYRRAEAEARRKWEEEQAYLAAHPQKVKKNWIDGLVAGLEEYNRSNQNTGLQDNRRWQTNCYTYANGRGTCYTSKQ